MGIVVVGLGPGSGQLLTREAWDVLSQASEVHLRTERHPAVADLPPAVKLVTFDAIYDSAETFADVYEQITTSLINLGREGDVVYAVPGHPHVGEATVLKLVEAASAENIDLRIVAGISFVEPMLTAVNVDALDGLQVFDALQLVDYSYPPLSSDVALLVGQVYSRLVASELKLVLNAIFPDEHQVALVHAAGEGAQQVEWVPLYAIDRSDAIGHLTSLYVPPMPLLGALPALAETVAVLRSPDGCPWDQEQTPQSMRSGFLEEAYEVIEALDSEDSDNLREELGDLLYHLVMQAQMAAEMGDFTLTDIVAGIETKLKRRHPHVWGDWQVEDSAEVVRNWDAIKQDEKQAKRASALDGVPPDLPALAKAQKIQAKAAKVGFTFGDAAESYDKVQEELAELQDAISAEARQAEFGDVVFALADYARHLDIDAETALRETIGRFDVRFRLVEKRAADQNQSLSALDVPQLLALWQEAKNQLGDGSDL